jgi:signal transduction histidine kinase
MTVRWRLLLTLGGIILLMMIPAAYAYAQLRHLREMVVALENVHAEDVAAPGEYRAALAEYDRLLRTYIVEPDDGIRESLNTELDFADAYLTRLEESYDVEVRPAFRILESLNVATDSIERLVEAGLAQQATDHLDVVKPLIDSARAQVTRLDNAIDERGRQQVAEAQQATDSAARTTMLAVGMALLLTVVLGLWATDALSRPLSRLSDATATVAEGNFSVLPDLPYDRADEIGHLSRSFESMTARLAELDRLKAEFVSLASHELKTPINVIAGYAELLDEGLYGDLQDRQREVVALIQNQTRSLTRLVNQLLDLSRFEAGGLPVDPQPVKIASLLDEVEGSFRALATQRQIDFAVEKAGALPETVVLDHDRVRHEVLGNLLSNAFKFTPTGGEIRVEAWTENGAFHLNVSDTGVGISEDQLDHIFDKYYQVGEEARSKGTGLGLAIAKHVVEAHGGRISVSSTVGEGTRFDIRFPGEG